MRIKAGTSMINIDDKFHQCFFTFILVIGIYLISIPVGEFVAGHDTISTPEIRPVRAPIASFFPHLR